MRAPASPTSCGSWATESEAPRRRAHCAVAPACAAAPTPCPSISPTPHPSLCPLPPRPTPRYSRYLSFHFPFTHERSLLEHLRAVPWRFDQRLFKVRRRPPPPHAASRRGAPPTSPRPPHRPALRLPSPSCPAAPQAWRQGRTGYPLVDAAMREVWGTGWMHNRMRVVAASFMVKNLLLPWQVRGRGAALRAGGAAAVAAQCAAARPPRPTPHAQRLPLSTACSGASSTIGTPCWTPTSSATRWAGSMWPAAWQVRGEGLASASASAVRMAVHIRSAARQVHPTTTPAQHDWSPNHPTTPHPQPSHRRPRVLLHH